MAHAFPLLCWPYKKKISLKVPRVIIGGGVAGATAAILLARANKQVLLIEREQTTRPKICGEFISCAAYDYLSILGIDLIKLGALPITTLRIASGHRVVTAELPFTGWSLSRDKLDEALLQHAAMLGADVRRGLTVRSLQNKLYPLLVVDGLGEIEADTVFMANGKHDLRGAARPTKSEHNLIGFKSYFTLTDKMANALDKQIELFLFAGGYAGLQLVGDKRANLSLLVSQTRFTEAEQNWLQLLDQISAENTLLGSYLSEAVPETDRPLAIFRLPFGFRHQPDGVPNVFRLGDQMACLPSFAGDGISIALHSAFHAVEAYLIGAHADIYHARLRRDLASQFLWGKFLSQLIKTPIGSSFFMTTLSFLPSVMPVLARITRLSSHIQSRAYNMEVF